MTAELSAVVARLGEDVLPQALGREHRLLKGIATPCADLLTWDDLNEILSTHRLEFPRLRLSANGDAVPMEAYTRRVVTRRRTTWSELRPALLHQRLAEGDTLVLDSLDELHPMARRLAVALEGLFRTHVQINAYASWTGQNGFATHWDDHDVVVLQLDGSKRWQIFGPTREAPLHRDVEAPPEPTGPPVAEFVMQAGDALYLPRGWWHNVRASEGERSLHITCGLTPRTGADLVAWVADGLRKHTVFRRDVPRFASESEKQAYVHALRELLAGELTYGSLIDEFAAHDDATERPRLRPSFPYLNTVPPDGGLTVSLLTSRHRIVREAGAVTFTAADEEYSFSALAEPFLTRLSDGEPHRLGDLVSGTGLSLDQGACIVQALVDGHAAALGDLR